MPRSVETSGGASQRLLRQATVLLLLALVPSSIAAWLHPRRPLPPDAGRVQEIALADALDLAAQETVLWIDARSPGSYADAHVPDAINLPETHWEARLGDFVGAWDPTQPVIVYCDSAGCGAAASVARRLVREFEATRVYYLKGGWESWQRERP